MMLLRRYLVIGSLLALFHPQAGAQAPKGPRFHVYIIGVTEFKIPEYSKDATVAKSLADSIRARCDDIETFFEGAVTDPNIQIDKHCIPSETTNEAIRRYLSVDLRDDGRDVLNFVFLMSHGEPVSYDNQLLSTDLRIIASDTDPNDVEFTSISLGAEVIPWLEKLSRKSTTLIFLDTCFSGAGKSLSARLNGTLQGIFGAKNLVVAASQSSDKAYQAAFTATVLDILGSSPQCVYDLKREVYERIQNETVHPLEGTEGQPEVVVPFIGSLCLGTLGGDGKLLFLYTGDEPSTTTYRISAASGNTFNMPRAELIQSPFFARRLSSGVYDIFISRNGAAEQKLPQVDLSTKDVGVVWLDDNVTATEQPTVLESMANIADDAGLPKEAVASLRLSASVSYNMIHDSASSKRVAALVDPELQKTLLPSSAQYLAFNNSAVLTKLKASDISEELTDQLALAGDFNNAAKLSKALADQSTNSQPKRLEMLADTYLYLGAEGALDAAKKLRKSNPKDIDVDPAVTSLETKAASGSQPRAKESFKAISGVEAATRLANTASVK